MEEDIGKNDNLGDLDPVGVSGLVKLDVLSLFPTSSNTDSFLASIDKIKLKLSMLVNTIKKF